MIIKATQEYIKLVTLLQKTFLTFSPWNKACFFDVKEAGNNQISPFWANFVVS